MQKEKPTKIRLYSQYLDIRERYWQSRGCGITALKMIADAYRPQSIFAKKNIDEIILEGVTSGAYIPKVGWSHSGLASLASRWNLAGKNYDWFSQKPTIALEKTKPFLKNGPILTSIHKDFDKKKSGHLIVLLLVTKDSVLFLDPAARTRKKIVCEIPTKTFLNGWKRRSIVIRPRIAK